MQKKQRVVSTLDVLLLSAHDFFDDLVFDVLDLVDKRFLLDRGQGGPVDHRPDADEFFERRSLPLAVELPGITEVGPVRGADGWMNHDVGLLDEEFIQIDPRHRVRAEDHIQPELVLEPADLARDVEPDPVPPRSTAAR